MSTQATDPTEHRLIVAGFGGQGILTAGKLLCRAAISEGRCVTFYPSYGAEVRGGTANCQVIISSGTIYSPIVEEADSLIILNLLSYDRFADSLKPGGLMVVNTSTVDTDLAARRDGAEIVEIPATELAAEMGDVRVANVIMLGAFARASDILAEESCRQAVQDVLRSKAALLDLNLAAFQRGSELAS